MPHVERVLTAFYERYGESPALESVMYGVNGDFGESIYPAGACGWNGTYHNHAGFWCAEPQAQEAYRQWLADHYRSVERLNRAWDTRFTDFSEVEFLLPDQVDSDARFMDQVGWYRQAMIDWCEAWFAVHRRAAPEGLPLYLCTGGNDSVPLGFDITAQVLSCAAHSVWLRLTNEGSVYASNFMGTRMLTTAAKLTGMPYGLEPAGAVTPNGIVARVFGSAAAGCSHVHFYEGQLANFGASAELPDRTPVWERVQEHLTVVPPLVNVAAVFPRTHALRSRQMGVESMGLYQALREFVDFDMVDGRLAVENLLGRYRFLVLGECRTLEEDALAALESWVRNGGVLLAAAQDELEVWRPFSTEPFKPVPPLAPTTAPWFSVDCRMPEVFDIHPGHVPDGVALTGTWSHPEGDARWGGRTAGLSLTVERGVEYEMEITAGVPVGGPVEVNGIVIGELEGRPGSHPSTLAIPASLTSGSGMLEIRFRLGAMEHPTDPRELCIHPSLIRLRRTDGRGSEHRETRLAVDAEALRGAVRRMGRGAVVSVPWTRETESAFPALVVDLLRDPSRIRDDIPACAVPDGQSDGVFVSVRERDLLVYNSNDRPVDVRLRIPAGAELDRTHTSSGTTVGLESMPPHSIRSLPLDVVVIADGAPAAADEER
jgi:hypothetical protein